MNILSTIAHQLRVLYTEGEARAMARCIVEDRFGLSPTDVAQGKGSELSADDKADLQNIVDRLLHNEPLQYVLGSTVFCGHRLKVGPGCLIPRPETEDLVHSIMDDLKDTPRASVLDIGTGSGCIAVSLALSTTAHFDVTAWDVSREALSIAEKNAEMLHANVRFELRDITNVGDEPRQWDIIVSNPPYVCQEEAAQMERNVLDHEPKIALFVPDDNPIVFYHFIGTFATSHLLPAGLLYVEINPRFSQQCMKLFRHLGFRDVSIRPDRYGKDRILKCQLCKSREHSKRASYAEAQSKSAKLTMKKEYSEQEATLRAADLCGASEQCRSQIEEKLKKWGQSPEAIARILKKLVKEKFIDESRFARAYALDKFRYNGWGKMKIRYNLRHLGISGQDCDHGIRSIPDEEYRDTLTQLLAAKSRSVKASSTYERRGKLIRFATGRGFEMDLVMSCLP